MAADKNHSKICFSKKFLRFLKIFFCLYARKLEKTEPGVDIGQFRSAEKSTDLATDKFFIAGKKMNETILFRSETKT